MMILMMSFSIIYTCIAQSRLDKSHKFVLIYFYFLFERESQGIFKIFLPEANLAVGKQRRFLTHCQSFFDHLAASCASLTSVSTVMQMNSNLNQQWRPELQTCWPEHDRERPAW
jgi:hypothetical protein